MTPEQRAAAERIVKYWKTLDPFVYDSEGRAEAAIELYQDDCEELAHAYTYEHPSDESDPVTVKEAFDMLGARASVVPVRNDDGSVTPYAWIGRHLKVDTKQRVNRLLAALEGK